MLTNYDMRSSMVGSLPYKDVNYSLNAVKKYMPLAPVCPQLTSMDTREQMVPQALNKFPGITLENGKYIFNLEAIEADELEKLVTCAFTDDYSSYSLEAYEASALSPFLSEEFDSTALISAHICGPITLGLSVFDSEGKAIIYDETAMDLLTKHIKLKAMWIENELRKVSNNTCIYFDEPSLCVFGSAYFTLSADKMTEILQEAQSGCIGLTGIHSCGETYWPIAFNTKCKIISLDAKNYGTKLKMYIPELTAYLNNGGSIAWGIIPTDAKEINNVDINTLSCQLNQIFDELIASGVDSQYLHHNSLITPACGLAHLNEKDAELALSMTFDLSNFLQKSLV